MLKYKTFEFCQILLKKTTSLVGGENRKNHKQPQNKPSVSVVFSFWKPQTETHTRDRQWEVPLTTLYMKVQSNEITFYCIVNDT